jgi:hypothetical protein
MRFQISDFRFQIADCRDYEIADFRLQISDFRLQIHVANLMPLVIEMPLKAALQSITNLQSEI